MSEQTTSNKSKFNLDEIEDDYSIIVPNVDKKGNFAHCKSITLRKMGKLDEGEPDDRKSAICFLFVEDETDAVLDYPCFEPILEEDDVNDKKKYRLYKNNMNRIKQMFNSFNNSPEGIDTKGKSFNDFTELYQFYMSQIEPDFSKIPVKLKVVYNKKGNVTLANVGKVISTKFRKCAFDWNPEYDFLERKGKKADSFDDDSSDDDDI